MWFHKKGPISDMPLIGPFFFFYNFTILLYAATLSFSKTAVRLK
jgi:hypothetical protein